MFVYGEMRKFYPVSEFQQNINFLKATKANQ